MGWGVTCKHVFVDREAKNRLQLRRPWVSSTERGGWTRTPQKGAIITTNSGNTRSLLRTRTAAQHQPGLICRHQARSVSHALSSHDAPQFCGCSLRHRADKYDLPSCCLISLCSVACSSFSLSCYFWIGSVLLLLFIFLVTFEDITVFA